MSYYRKKFLGTGSNFMPQLKISCHWKKYPNYCYFGRLLSRLTSAVSGEIFGWKYWLQRSKLFYPTLGKLPSLYIKSQPPTEPKTLQKVGGGWWGWLNVIWMLSVCLDQADKCSMLNILKQLSIMPRAIFCNSRNYLNTFHGSIIQHT